MLTRFAPSPTGFLHLGHVVNAIYVWGYAGAHRGRVLLRMEDHDRIRSRPEFERAIVDDLAWLGFARGGSIEQDAPYDDEERRRAGPALWTRQSDHPEIYEEALATLRRTAHVYACDCSRKDIRERQADEGSAEHYNGHCRGRGLEDAAGRGLRVVLEPGVERFDDLRLGLQTQSPAQQCGDLLLRDRDGHWTYQFAVTVDDVRQRITHVIRGEDLLPSTGRQIQLARMLGRSEPARFLHHPLLMKRSGEKLSKAAQDTGIRELRGRGLSAAEVIGRAAAAAGLVGGHARIAADEVPSLFR